MFPSLFYTEDPVRMFEHVNKQPSSVIKFLCDVYSHPDTSGLLYTNDARVLIDVIVGRLSDLGPGDEVCPLISSL